MCIFIQRKMLVESLVEIVLNPSLLETFYNIRPRLL